jgi:hypothetical protein
MASSLFCHRFLDDLGLQALLGVHLFLRRRFSSSNSRRRAINEAFMPPNLARHL